MPRPLQPEAILERRQISGALTRRQLSIKVEIDEIDAGRQRQTRGAIDRTVRILQNELSLDKSKYVTSKNALMPLVYLLAKVRRAGHLERNAVRFFILAQLSEHYGGSGETTLRKDFRARRCRSGEQGKGPRAQSEPRILRATCSQVNWDTARFRPSAPKRRP